MALSNTGQSTSVDPAALTRQPQNTGTSRSGDDLKAMASGIQEWLNGTPVFSDLPKNQKPARRRGKKAPVTTK